MRHTEIFVQLDSENLEVKGLILQCPAFCVLEKTSESHASYLKIKACFIFRDSDITLLIHRLQSLPEHLMYPVHKVS